VGILSAALKKGRLTPAGYQAMLDTATQLNVAGPRLAQVDGVHAMTDVTGFGLAGHLLEMCAGAGLGARVEFDRLPVIEEARRWVAEGIATGASARNWKGYGDRVKLPPGFDAWRRDLLTDPQTSGGLLVACDPGAGQEVLQVFRESGFADAACIGTMTSTRPGLEVLA
jgi:selenide,water dikinase